MPLENTDDSKSQITNCAFGITTSEDSICDNVKNLLDQAMDGNPDNSDIVKKAQETLQSCNKCKNILDLQLKLRQTMTTHLKVSAPKQLRIDISANLKLMDLGKLDITDFFPPK